MSNTTPPVGADAEIIRLCVAYTAERAAFDALWPRGDVDPAPSEQAAIAAGSARLIEMHEALTDLQPASVPALRAMAEVFLAHVAKDEYGDPSSDRDVPLVSLARAVLGVVRE